MTRCLDCGFQWEDNASATVESCPRCERTMRADAATTHHAWVDVARVTNLAEAGFLSDELIGMDIDARIHQTDEFSELHGGWKTQYLIRVPAEFGQEAAARLRSYVVEADPEPAGDERFRFGEDAGQFDPAYWRPVAFVVLAGVASFVLGRQTAAPVVDPRPAPDSLAAAAGAIGRPFVTEVPAGAPRHRLSFDRSRRIWQLDADVNGDGVFDVQRQFSATGAAR